MGVFAGILGSVRGSFAAHSLFTHRLINKRLAMPWFLYLIECSDDSIYTGIAVDVDARYQKHLNGTGARYTRSRPPRRLLAQFELADRSSASKAEYRVKRLSAAQKRALAEGQIALPVPDDTLDETSNEVAAVEALVQADPA